MLAPQPHAIHTTGPSTPASSAPGHLLWCLPSAVREAEPLVHDQQHHQLPQRHLVFLVVSQTVIAALTAASANQDVSPDTMPLASFSIHSGSHSGRHGGNRLERPSRVLASAH
jgi:hypothetical protein